MSNDINKKYDDKSKEIKPENLSDRSQKEIQQKNQFNEDKLHQQIKNPPIKTKPKEK